MMQNEEFFDRAIAAIEHLGVTRANFRSVVILERVARGAGMTNWFACDTWRKLEQAVEKLRPGSVVSLYFDNRIGRTPYPSSLAIEIARIVQETGDCVVGRLEEDGVTLRVQFVSSLAEWEEIADGIAITEQIYYGPFPGRDNGGEEAITFTLPDSDGVVRAHPH